MEAEGGVVAVTSLPFTPAELWIGVHFIPNYLPRCGLSHGCESSALDGRFISCTSAIHLLTFVSPALRLESKFFLSEMAQDHII